MDTPNLLQFTEPDEQSVINEPETETAETETQDSRPDSEEHNENLPSREELLQAYTEARRLIDQKEQEAESLRYRLEQMGAGAAAMFQKAEQEAFLREVRDAYAKDPLAATAMLVQKVKQEALEEVESRIHKVLDDQRNFARLMNEFISTPMNAHLKPYRQELEFLILEKGLAPDEAAELLRSIEGKRSETSRRRSAAAGEIRNRAAVESGSAAGEPANKEKEFDRVLKKARTLDEMFAGLRKLKG